MGPDGDFVTYPSAHPAFGRLLARQVAECWEAMDHPTPFTLVEMGGGRGVLARDMTDFIASRYPDLGRSMDVLLVDESPALRRLQEGATLFSGRVRTMDPEAFFQEIPPITGCLLSNELVDALPVHLVEQREGVLHEVLVEVGEESVHEVFQPVKDPRMERYLQQMGADLADGHRTEAHLAAVDWMRRVGRALHRGLVITIDFGYVAADYYHPLRTRGTLLSYKAHRASPDPYGTPGGEDLSAHVNFTALIEAGREVGLQLTGLVTQDRFLLALGLLEEMEAQEAGRERVNPVAFWKEKLALRRFMIPQSPAGGFQVLVQHKGWEPPPLRGLRNPWEGATGERTGPE